MRRFGLAFVTVSAALALVACGGGGGGGATTAPASSGTHVRWVATDLGVAPGWDECIVESDAINELGQVVSTCVRWDQRSYEYRHVAAVWANGRWRTLGTLGGRDSFAHAINNRGQVAGVAERRSGPPHAVTWENGTIRDLGTLPGFRRWPVESEATAINDEGKIVGSSGSEQNCVHAVLWKDGSITDLGRLSALQGGRLGKCSEALAVNDRGDVAGWRYSNRGDKTLRAFVLRDGEMTDLGALLGDDNSKATAISERGHVIGWARSRNISQGFIWDGRHLHAFGAGSDVQAINASGQAVGSARVNGKRRSFVWEEGDLGYLRNLDAERISDRGEVVGTAGDRAVLWDDGHLITLPQRASDTRSSATAINNQGQIIGWSETRSGKRYAVLWTLKR